MTIPEPAGNFRTTVIKHDRHASMLQHFHGSSVRAFKNIRREDIDGRSVGDDFLVDADKSRQMCCKSVQIMRREND